MRDSGTRVDGPFLTLREAVGAFPKRAILWSQLMEQLPQLQARSFQGVRVMAPIAPARSDGQDRGVHEGDLPHVFENLRVLVILNAVANGLKPYPRRGFAGGDWTRRVEKNSIAWSAEPAAASGGIHIVPTTDGVPGGPPIGAVIKDTRRALRPI
jgi:hypothetical protein